MPSSMHAKFHPNRCNVSPLRGEKPQNRPRVIKIPAACATRNAAGKNDPCWIVGRRKKRNNKINDEQ